MIDFIATFIVRHLTTLAARIVIYWMESHNQVMLNNSTEIIYFPSRDRRVSLPLIARLHREVDQR